MTVKSMMALLGQQAELLGKQLDMAWHLLKVGTQMAALAPVGRFSRHPNPTGGYDNRWTTAEADLGTGTYRLGGAGCQTKD